MSLSALAVVSVLMLYATFAVDQERPFGLAFLLVAALVIVLGDISSRLKDIAQELKRRNER